MGRAVMPAGWLDVRGPGRRKRARAIRAVWPGRARAAATSGGGAWVTAVSPLACLGLALTVGPVRPGGSGRRDGRVSSGSGGGPAAGPGAVEEDRGGGRGQGGGQGDEGDLPAGHAASRDHLDRGRRRGGGDRPVCPACARGRDQDGR